MNKFLVSFTNGTRPITIESEDKTSAFNEAYEMVCDLPNVEIKDIEQISFSTDIESLDKELIDNLTELDLPEEGVNIGKSETKLDFLNTNESIIIDNEGIKIGGKLLSNEDVEVLESQAFDYMENLANQHFNIAIEQVITIELTEVISKELKNMDVDMNSADDAMRFVEDSIDIICNKFINIMPHRKSCIEEIKINLKNSPLL